MNALKRRRIRSIIFKGKADIFLIQETKVVSMNEIIANGFWKSMNIDFYFSNSEGRSGGLITLWKEYCMSVMNSFKGDVFWVLK